MKPDPFEVRQQYSKWHPRRLSFYLQTRAEEYWSRLNFERYVIPRMERPGLPPAPDFDSSQTAVVSEHIQYLLAGLSFTERFAQSVVVEVGSFKGVTTNCLAQATQRTLVAVDPYFGYGGTEDEFLVFKENTKNCSNVLLLRKTSGQAWREWSHGAISMIFIDAMHDYVNVSFDLAAWGQKLLPGGLIAVHDTANPAFAGCRRAAYNTLKTMGLWANPGNLVILQKRP